MALRSKVIIAMVLSAGVLLAGGLGHASSVNGQSPADTPSLLETAVARDDLSQDQADLYLAYALTDYEKLPSQYRSDTPWDGTLPLPNPSRRPWL